MLTLVTAPAEQPITLAEAKAYLRIDHAADDTLLSDLISASVSWLDGAVGHLGRCIITQVWDLKLSAFSDVLHIPLPPLQSVDSIKYIDAGGTETTLASDQYVITKNSYMTQITRAYGVSWPSFQDIEWPLTVRFTAGYGNAAAVPQDLKLLCKYIISSFYEQRLPAGTGLQSIPYAAQAIIDKYRTPSL